MLTKPVSRVRTYGGEIALPPGASLVISAPVSGKVHPAKSGEIPGYAFSDAMKNAGLTWDDATLDEYLTAPMKKVPGTKMTFAGLSDPAARKEVIAYLKTLK